MSRLEPYDWEDPRGKTIEVDQGEVKKAQPPDVVETGGLGPCVGIFIYDPVTKQAIAAHFTDPIQDEKIFSEMLDEVDQIFPDKQRLRVYIGGGGPLEEESLDETKETRSFVKEEIKRRGFQKAQVKIRWTDDSLETVQMRLTTETGEVEYDISESPGSEN